MVHFAWFVTVYISLLNRATFAHLTIIAFAKDAKCLENNDPERKKTSHFINQFNVP